VVSVLQIYNSFGANALTDLQIKIRDLCDLDLTGLTCSQMPIGVLDYLSQDFETQTSNVDIGISGWLNTAVAGTRKWQGKYFSPNTYAQATAFGSGLSNMETWLITPRLNLSKADTLTFESAKAFWAHDGLTVWISTNFDGTNVSAATWSPLTCTLAGQFDADYTFVASGIIPLTTFTGTGYIGFKYTGNSTSQTTTYQLDNVIVH
ncbi:MAG: choice-of-anchor J domain-containing protein, partial [Bacteroidota bacterium]